MNQPAPGRQEPAGLQASPDHGAIGLPAVNSNELFGSGRELLIRHAGNTYHLKITGSNKLILTK